MNRRSLTRTTLPTALTRTSSMTCLQAPHGRLVTPGQPRQTHWLSSGRTIWKDIEVHLTTPPAERRPVYMTRDLAWVEPRARGNRDHERKVGKASALTHSRSRHSGPVARVHPGAPVMMEDLRILAKPTRQTLAVEELRTTATRFPHAPVIGISRDSARQMILLVPLPDSLPLNVSRPLTIPYEIKVLTDSSFHNQRRR